MKINIILNYCFGQSLIHFANYMNMKKILPFWLLIIAFFYGTFSLKAQNALGCELSKEKFEAAYIYARLAGTEKLPSSASLLKYAPTRGNQGEQGSCVGWASAYSAYSIIYSAANGTSPNSYRFSPAYVFNQITANSYCDGSYIFDALDLMKSQGILTLDDFPYSESDCSVQPTSAQRKKASQYKILGYNRLTNFADEVDLEAVKQNVANGSPVVIGMPIGGSFIDFYGTKLWEPTQDDYAGIYSFGGHAMCVIGYDDNYAGGAVQIMNSWGVNWGDNGVFWMPYKDFENFCFEAYGIDPLPKQVTNNDNEVIDFRIKIALLSNTTNKPIPLERKGTYIFETVNNLSVGAKFKIGIENSVPCYTYVLGEETDGTSYVLFPYTEKHSAYFGITGKRIFPEDYSMRLDDIGKKDKMSIILSKKPLDIYQIRNKINSSNANSFEEKVIGSLGSEVIAGDEVRFRKSEIVMFEVLNTPAQDVVPIFIEIDK